MPRPHPSRRLVPAVAAVVATMSICSCGSGTRRMYPVHGEVFVAGRPATGAIVVFHPVDESSPTALKPSARVEADGSFTLGTLAVRDGAPAGAYVVAIAWLGDTSQADPATGELPVKLSQDYADSRMSPLRAQVVEGPNEIPAFYLPK